MQARDPGKRLYSLLILIFLIAPGCLAQSSRIATPSLAISPTATFTRTSSPTTTPTATETATPPATELPLIEMSSQNSVSLSAEFPEITEIHMTSETSGWAFASSGDKVHVLHTSDGGISWLDVTPPIEIWSAYIRQNEFFEPRLGEGYFLDERRGWISTQIVDSYDTFAAKIMLSTDDGGATWRMRTLPKGLGVGYGTFVNFIDPMHGWFVVYDYAGAGGAYLGLYRTMDGGDSWKAVHDVLGSSSGLSGNLDFGDPTTGVMTFKRFGWFTSLRVNWTQDGGMTWQSQYLPEPEDPSIADPSISDFECGTAFPHAFSKLEVALLVECRMLKDTGSPENKYIFSNFLYLTEDGGLSWQSFPAPSGRLFLLNPNVGWMLGEEIHLTEDGGKNWTKINEVKWQGQFNFIDRHHGWAVARNDDEIALLNTKNSGRTWIIVEPQPVP